MKNLLLLLTLSSNIHAETVTLDDIQLPNNMDKVQWLQNNLAKPVNPNENYPDTSFKYIPLKPLAQSKSNCQYGKDILGGCKVKQIISKPLTYDKNNKFIKDYTQMKLKYDSLDDNQKHLIIQHFKNSLIVKPVAELKKILNSKS